MSVPWIVAAVVAAFGYLIGAGRRFLTHMYAMVADEDRPGCCTDCDTRLFLRMTTLMLRALVWPADLLACKVDETSRRRYTARGQGAE